MNIEKNKEIVKEFFTNLNELKFNEAFESLHEDLNWWTLGSMAISGEYDKRKISLALKILYRSFDNFIFTFSTLTAEENRVSIILESHGIRKTTNKNYNNHYHFLFILKENKIIGVREFFDTMHAQWIGEME